MRRRAAMGAATALALVVLQTGAALAADPAPPAPTPAGDFPAAGYGEPDAAADQRLLDLMFDPAGDPVLPAGRAPAGPGLLAPPTGARMPPAALADGVVDLTTCALAVVACPPAGPARIVCDLVPYVKGEPGALPAPPVPPMATAPPTVATAPPTVPVDDQLPSGAAEVSGGDGAAPALDAVGLALGPAVRPATAVPASGPAPPPAARDGAAPGLASTGTPVEAALAGLVLLAVGGCLTWARSCGRQT